ncbi:PhoH family protein [bacterium AH-315-M10]|nr:PhoH family protein [bacterium AH-315-M10]
MVLPVIEEQIKTENERDLFGRNDANLRLIREMYGVTLVARSGLIKLQGEPEDVAGARDALARLQESVRQDGAISGEQARLLVRGDGPIKTPPDGHELLAVVGDKLRPKSEGQHQYVKAMEQSDVVFAVGPAGTGKTFLAVAVAVGALQQGLVRRIVLVRPAVEAGEKLGFLPGDLQAKINPYLRPLYDALGHILSPSEISRKADKDQIEIVPLAYMRGRTLRDAFIIMDEAQNTTPAQMKMFLTRLGMHSRAVITGDITQIDLAPGQQSGLVHALKVLKDVKGIRFATLGRADIVRHPLVGQIVDAYEAQEQSEQ